MISFVVPAHNEEACLPQTLEAIKASALATGEPFEIVVANDASTDRTAEIAEQHGARVVHVQHRQIAATRNSGARAALGDRIFFVDADTQINAAAVKASLRALDNGAVGGGAMVKIDGRIPLYARVFEVVCYVPSILVGFCGGAFMYCTREAFHATGGFNEKVFWAEEGYFGFALKRLGRFIVVWPRVLTSGRRFRTLNGKNAIAFIFRAILHPRKVFTERAFVQKIWYDSNRSEDNVIPKSVSAKITNSIALLLTLSMITGPLWYLVPWSSTPLSTPFGKFRFANAVFLCHVSLLCWPLTVIFLVNLLRQRRTLESLKTLILAAFCAWQALESSVSIVYIWRRFIHWIV
jgi:glycosyltransferase involved in cell wall biosynthesis